MKKKSEDLEMNIYRVLGVEVFRKLIMQYEKFIHRKDFEKNINYHIKSFSGESVKRFYAFLSYNASVHILSSAIVFLYFLFKSRFAPEFMFLDFIMILLLVLNLYCIMLQRYNCLSIRRFLAKYEKHREKRVSALENKLIKKFVSSYPKEHIDEDLSFLYGIRAAVRSGECLHLSKNDVSIINRLSEQSGDLISKRKCHVSKCAESEKTVGQILSEITTRTSPYTKIEKRADKLQKILGIENTVLNPVCVIFTNDSEEETAFRKLFRSDSEDVLSEVTEVLISALESTGEKQGNYVE